MKRYHKIWKVRIVSGHDAGPIMLRPPRAEYLIESRYKNGIVRLQKAALALAAEDGIPSPVVAGMEWINCPFRLPDETDKADWWKA